MVNELKSPRDLARLRAQRDDRARPPVVAGPQSAVVVRARAAGRHEHEVTLGIDAHDRPRIGCAGRRRGGWRGAARYRVPPPPWRAGARVERAHHAVGHVDASVVVDRGSDDHHIVDDSRRRRHVVLTLAISGDARQIDVTAASEVGARRSGPRIERDEPRVERRFVNAPAARLVRAASGIEPCRDAAIDQTVAVARRLVDLRIVGPSLLACFRIERDDAIERRAEVQDLVDDDRRRLEAAA